MSGIHCSIAGATYALTSTLSYRSDPYASNLILCLPFDTENQFTDITPTIKGSGTSASSTQGGNSTITTTQKKWSLTYAKSLENAATVSTQSMTYTLPSSLPSSASGTFVIEGWFYANNATSNANWAISSADTNGRFLFGINSGSTFSFASENNIGIGSGWHHIAIVCDAGTKRFYYDAIYKGAWVSSNTGFTTLHLGQFGASDHNDYRGHIQDFRIYSGTNKGYTGTSTTVANFAVPDSVILIAERTAKTVTASGNAQISTAQSKFGGASLLLDGTTDYIQVDSAELAVGTGDFTFECFARVVDSSNFMLFDQTNPTGSTNGLSIWLGSGGLNVYSGGWIVQTLGTIANNTWYHIAVSLDSSNNLKAFINGTQIGSTTTFTNNINQTILRMGSARIDAGYDGNGYMDEIRVSNTARYTANFTAPTAAFTNDSNTLLLLHCNGDNTGTTFVDDVGTNEMPRTPKTITASGNAQISTAQSKFGGASALFDGTGDRLTVTSTGDFGFSGDFTLEGWFRFSSFPSQFFLFDFRLSTDGSVVKPTLYYTTSSGGSIRYFVNGADRIQSTAFASTTNTWYHIALCKSGTSTKLFINGTQDGSTYTDTNTYVDSNCAIGDYAGGAYGLNGYADEIRFSNTARYTANFTAPTAAFSNDRDTLLLIHCNGTNTQTTFFDDNIWANTVGNTYFTPPSAELTSDGSTIALWHLNSALTDSGPSALTLSTSGGYNTTTKKFGTASGDLSDSTTDFFARATTGHYWIYGGTAATGARQYTIEFWTYNTVFTNNSETDGGGFQLPLTFGTAAAGVGLTTTGKMTQNQFPSPRGSTTGVDVGADSAPTSQWVHQAYVIGNDMKWRGYLDGKLQFIQTAIDPSSIYTTATDIQIGRNSSSGTNANLMIDEIRLSSTKRYGS